jgi:hypothetical protein
VTEVASQHINYIVILIMMNVKNIFAPLAASSHAGKWTLENPPYSIFYVRFKLMHFEAC